MPNETDHLDALAILTAACIGNADDKVKDGKRTMERSAVSRIAANSRSFRRFLRVLDHPNYVDQSRLPAQR